VVVVEDDARAFRAKALESLATAESELANHRYNSCANRCYYACFQAAIALFVREGLRSTSKDGRWSHAAVQSVFAGVLIGRRKLVPSDLRDTLVRAYLLRETADYTPEQVSRTQAERSLRRAREFVRTVNRAGSQ
jgi:uncharacterized protein (UPF0332 family)